MHQSVRNMHGGTFQSLAQDSSVLMATMCGVILVKTISRLLTYDLLPSLTANYIIILFEGLNIHFTVLNPFH